MYTCYLRRSSQSSSQLVTPFTICRAFGSLSTTYMGSISLIMARKTCMRCLRQNERKRPGRLDSEFSAAGAGHSKPGTRSSAADHLTSPLLRAGLAHLPCRGSSCSRDRSRSRAAAGTLARGLRLRRRRKDLRDSLPVCHAVPASQHAEPVVCAMQGAESRC